MDRYLNFLGNGYRKQSQTLSHQLINLDGGFLHRLIPDEAQELAHQRLGPICSLQNFGRIALHVVPNID